jgi:cytochrome c-type biogenesis protein CcmH/NrfG
MTMPCAHASRSPINQAESQRKIPVLATARRLDPANPAWPIGLAILLSSLQRHAEAVAVFEQLLALVPLENAHHHALASALLSTW